MQIPLRTLSSVDAYIGNREWRDARLSGCPLHPLGGCSFARHGSYARVTPSGLRIARWYCPEGRRSFSLLPDFLAARLPGLLASIEDCITVASSAKSMEAAADTLRGPDVTLPGAVRWLRRRIRAVRMALAHVTPEAVIGQSGDDGGSRDRSRQGTRADRPSSVALATDAERYSGAVGLPACKEGRVAVRRQRPTRDGP